MVRKDFWKSDWFLGVIVALVVILLSGTDLVKSLERKAYDLGVRASSRTPSERVAVIAIDDTSIANIGRWPWPRDVHAQLIDKLASAQAKVIGYTVFFSEPQIDPALPYINKLNELYGLLSPAGQTQLGEFGSVLKEAEHKLNTDRKLADSVSKAGNVVLPILFHEGQPLGKPDQELPDFLRKQALSVQQGDGPAPVPAASLDLAVLPQLGAPASAIGHLNSVPDVDGAIRTDALVVGYYDQYYPALSLQIVAKSLNLAPGDMKVRLGEGVGLGRLNVRTDSELQMLTYFYRTQDGRFPFTLDSFYDVYSSRSVRSMIS